MTEQKRGITFSLRTRMTVMMTVLLLLALAALQYQNQQAQLEVQRALAKQSYDVRVAVDDQLRAIISAANIGVQSLSDTEYLDVSTNTKYRNALDKRVIRHLIVVKESGEIEDSIEPEFVKLRVEIPANLTSETTDPDVPYFVVPTDALAPLTRTGQEESATYWFKTKTNKGYYFVGVVASSEAVSNAFAQSQATLSGVVKRTAAERVNVTLGVFGLALLLTILLVWRFTRPIRKLSHAAERVARGDLDFATDIRRRDEIGQLSLTFDQMIQQLKAKSELEDRLNNAERAAVIGRLTGAIAHEIRNPLNFINLSIDHVREKFPPAEPRDRDRFDRLLGSIKEEIGRLNRMVLDVLNFGRPANLNFRTVDLRDVVESVIGLARQQADEQGVTIETRLPATPTTAEADVEKLKSCFSNIVVNAFQAMPLGGRLTVEVATREDGPHVRFTDTGVGIPEEALDRVFEPYYSTKDTGTGLGLAVTKKLVDEHGGRVRVTSAVGEGTTFDIALPASRAGTGDAGASERPGQLVSAGAGSARAGDGERNG